MEMERIHIIKLQLNLILWYAANADIPMAGQLVQVREN